MIKDKRKRVLSPPKKKLSKPSKVSSSRKHSSKTLPLQNLRASNIPLSKTKLNPIIETEPPVIKRKEKRLSTACLPNSPIPSFGSLKVSYKLEQNENFREYMEDYILTIRNLNKQSSSHLFCVFDGHGGKDSAELCTKLYPEILRKKIMTMPYDIEGCLETSFHLMDKELEKKKYEDLGNTATVVYINNHILYCANVGDSSCVLIEKNKARFISVDDDFLNKNEIKRLKDAGANISDERLEGELAITRSMGDFNLKNKGLIVDPHINKIILDSNSRYCILGSDGIWDDLGPDDVLKICNEFNEPDIIVNKIVEQALESGSEDNISCIVIQFNN